MSLLAVAFCTYEGLSAKGDECLNNL